MTEFDDAWWPGPLSHVPKRDFLSEEMVVVSELSEGARPSSTRDLHLALLDPDDAERLLECREDFPFSYVGGTGLLLDSEKVHVESLATKWEGGCNHYVQFPSLDFVKHFGLVPRLLDSALVWDDLGKPLHDVVHVEMVAEYDNRSMSAAFIRIRRDYLLKYADATGRAIVALWYEWNSERNADINGDPYQESEFGTHMFPGRMVQFGLSAGDCEEVVAELWGILPVYSPVVEAQPIAHTQTDFSHKWPGLEHPVERRTRWHPAVSGRVYVSDSVLARYEEHPDLYTVHAESGGVSYGNQWSISRCRRIGRDLISVDIKGLYEGTPDDQIIHWNAHAVLPPKNPLEKADASVGLLAKQIVFDLIELGEVLSRLSSIIAGEQIEPCHFVRLDGDKLKRHWWYDDELIRPITCHIPLDIGKDTFLNRCKSLTKLVVESLGEKHLRGLLLSWNVESNSIKSLGSLKLLDSVLQMAKIANDCGLSIRSDGDEILSRYDKICKNRKRGDFLPSPISFLFKLYDLRLLDAHQGGTEDKVLETLGIRKAEVVSGWGKQMDRVYQSISKALLDAITLLRAVR